MSDNTNSLPKDLELTDKWDTSALRALVDDRCHKGRKPSHLFLGITESELLREHLNTLNGEINIFQDKQQIKWNLWIEIYSKKSIKACLSIRKGKVV